MFYRFPRTAHWQLYETFCKILYHFFNSKNVINARERVLLLVKLQPEACNPAKSNTPLWGFFFHVF